MRIIAFTSETDTEKLDHFLVTLEKLELYSELHMWNYNRTPIGEMWWFKFDDKSDDDA